jgi:hypothetical protein
MSTETKPYIPIDVDLPECEELGGLSMILGRSENEIMGALIRVWRFATHRLAIGSDRANFVTPEKLDQIAGLSGLAQAMVRVGWLVVGESWLEFPGYNDGGRRKSIAQFRHDKGQQTRKATAAKAAQQAKAEQTPIKEKKGEDIVTGIVTTNATMIVTTDATDIATMDATGDNINININTNNNTKIFPPSPVPGADPKPPLDSHFPSNSGQRPTRSGRHERRSDRILQLLSLSLAESWAKWIQHLADLNELPSMETARIWAQRIDRLPIGESSQLIAKAIERGWYTLDGPSGGRPEKAPARLPDSGGQGSGECPRPYPTANGSPMREGQDWYWRDKATGARWRFSKASGKWVGA